MATGFGHMASEANGCLIACALPADKRGSRSGSRGVPMLTRRRFLQSTAVVGSSLAFTPAVFPTSVYAHQSAMASSRVALAYDPGQTLEVQSVDVPYRQAGGQSWLARVYQPQGSGPFPALLELHGGIWTDNDRRFDEPINLALASSGLVIAAIDFRQGADNPYPSSLADINLAVRWLKAHAPDFNADPRVVGGFGGSSGGHLILLSAMRPRDPRYAELPLIEARSTDATLAYVVGHCPAVDPAARYEFAKQTGRADLISKQDAYFGSIQTMQEANPLQILERREEVELPPTLILHGTADMNVPVGYVENFAAAYRAAFMRQNLSAAASPDEATAAYRTAGDLVQLQEFAGMPHYFLHPAVTTGPEQQRGLQIIKEVIAKQLASISTA